MFGSCPVRIAAAIAATIAIALPAVGSDGGLDAPPPIECVRRLRDARIEEQAGHAGAARAALWDAVRAFPKEIAPLLDLLAFDRRIGLPPEERERAEATFRRVLADDGARLPLTSVLRAVEDRDTPREDLAAIRDLLERRASGPEFPERRILEALATVERRLGDASAARSTLGRLLETRRDATVLRACVRLDVELERWDDAVGDLKGLVDELAPELRFLPRLRLLALYGKIGDRDAALRLARDLRKETDLHDAAVLAPVAAALEDAAWSMRDLGRDEQARALFLESLEVEPGDDELRRALAYLYGAPEEIAALEAKRDAAYARSDDAGALLEEGSKRLAAGDAAGAYPLLERACGAGPSLELAWFDLGLAAIKLERFGDAVAALEHAVALKPDRPESQLNLASALERLDRCPEALPILERLHRDHPDVYQADYYLYRCYKAAGDEERAVEALGRYNAAVKAR